MRVTSLLALAALAVALAAAPALAHEGARSFEPAVVARHYKRNSANTFFVQNAVASDFSAEELAIQFLSGVEASSQPEGINWIFKNVYTSKHNGVTHVYLRQTLNGMEIMNADANVNIDANGNILSGSESGVADFDSVVTSSLWSASFVSPKSPVDAMQMLASKLSIPLGPVEDITPESFVADNNLLFSAPGLSLDEIPVKAAYIQTGRSSSLRPVWNMVVRQENSWFDVNVDAETGDVISMIDWVADYDVSYEVFKQPNLDFRYGDRKVVRNPALKNASPSGWHVVKRDSENGVEYITTIGNNVIAQENRANLDVGWENNYRPRVNTTVRGHKILPYDMKYPIDTTLGPETYQDASITNLFYWNNFLHDIFYQYGFTEESGNFQEQNFNRGGLGGDAVQANAQDGSGNNNANFATPPDGRRPRMRMYIYTRSDPYRDGALDSGIVTHEYSHGVSTRLTGGPANSNCLGVGQAGGMGEGWGDCFGAMFEFNKKDNADTIFYHAAYASNKFDGNRKYGYTGNMTANPHTFASFNLPGNDEVHASGNIWCSILWEGFVSMVHKHGFSDWTDVEDRRAGNHMMMQNVIDGMKLQPCRPTFVDARDAILLADSINYHGSHECLLWKAFAKRGLGVSANATASPVEEAFDIPPSCARA